MATRQEVQQRRKAMRQALIEECRSSSAFSGTMLPPLHELSRRHGVSMPIVSETIQELVKEGVLHTRRGAGTFVGPMQSPESVQTAPFLLILSDDGSGALHRAALRRGFEDRVTERGGFSLSLSVDAVLQLREQGASLPVAGIFDFHELPGDVLSPGDLEVPRVEFERVSALRPGSDIVDFDNVGGGRLAAEHLLRLGHKRIAFLGVHGDGHSVTPWSAERAQGWQQALQKANYFNPQLLFTHMCHAAMDVAQAKAARIAATAFVQVLMAGAGATAGAVTAVVAANHIAANQLLNLLSSSGLASQHWPSIVAFDEQMEGVGHVLSTLRLPWESIGREAADLLWERNQESVRHRNEDTGLPFEPPRKRLVPMRLIPRLTCQPVWSSTPGAVALAVPDRPQKGKRLPRQKLPGRQQVALPGTETLVH